MEIINKTFETIPAEQLLQTFDEGFADYEVNMKYSLDFFKTSLTRFNYDPSLSVAAYDGKRPVGFIINGRGDWNGLPTIYDGGTCVIPSYRNKGIASDMISAVKEIAVREGQKQWIVECSQTNMVGLALYEKHGFEVHRRFDSLSAPSDGVSEKTAACYDSVIEKGLVFGESSINEIQKYSDFQDTTPCWQNSDKAVVAGNLSVVSLKDSYGKMCGYVMFSGSGYIARLAIAPLRRSNGYGKALLHYVAAVTEAKCLTFVNINEKNRSMIEFLSELGFTIFARQFELSCKLT